MLYVLILGLIVFLGVHSTRIVAGPWRDARVAANPGRWKGLYSLASLIGFALIIWGWIGFRAEAPTIYDPPSWGRHLAMLFVWLAFVALAAAYAPVGYIKSTLKHPMLTAVILWALAHLLANGDLASLLLFGSFLAYAIVDRIAVIPRGDPAPRPVTPMGDVVALTVGTVAYAAVAFWLHQVLFGVSPMG